MGINFNSPKLSHFALNWSYPSKQLIHIRQTRPAGLTQTDELDYVAEAQASHLDLHFIQNNVTVTPDMAAKRVGDLPSISSTESADPLAVEDYLDYFEDISSVLLEYIVNMTDISGNTAMHYAVSHGNFDVVSILLDSKKSRTGEQEDQEWCANKMDSNFCGIFGVIYMELCGTFSFPLMRDFKEELDV
uniref:Uncharacterized protein n=1 Tax=Timema genevievae TaxID=629358 RepID=A0A7R9K0H0_TIMGE|nr:unnamed protein product [Timema genevievae]